MNRYLAQKQRQAAHKNLLVEAEKEARDIFRDIEPPYIWKKYLLDNKEKLERNLPDTVTFSRNSMKEHINKDINNNYRLLAQGLKKDFLDDVQQLKNRFKDTYPHISDRERNEVERSVYKKYPSIGMVELEEPSRITLTAMIIEELENKYYDFQKQKYINDYMTKNFLMAMKKYIPRNTLRNNLKKATNSKLTANNLMGGKRTRKNRKNKKHLPLYDGKCTYI